MKHTKGLSRVLGGWSMKSVMLLTGLSMARGAAVQESTLITTRGAVTVTTITNAASAAGVDFVNAKPKELPAVAPSGADAQLDLMNALTAPRQAGSPGSSAGSVGTGAASPVTLGTPTAESLVNELSTNLGILPQEFGTTNHPFSTARVNLTPALADTSYPYRAAGKLFFVDGGSTYLCSASLIKRGVVVTAAHCVANFGKKQFYSKWQFVPAYRNGSAPYGVWTVREAVVLTSYYSGTDSCASAGVVCTDDMAVLLLNPSGATYPGTSTGWYGYGYNGYGFTSSALTQVSQLGYPVCLDNGLQMERNDSYGYRSPANSNNTIIGTLMCGGSSGGPWLVNLGVRPALTGTTAGTAPDANIVVGVTSWGYTSNGPKETGASAFTSTNIVTLVNTACAAVPGACS
jgi:V8-like Glu-specific endopeptidase